MAVIGDFTIIREEDGLLYIDLAPPVAIGGMNLVFQVTKRTGGTDVLFTRSVSSGLNGASGLTVTDSGQGRLKINLYSRDTSGFDYGNYAFQVRRNDSGSRTVLTEGYLVVNP